MSDLDEEGTTALASDAEWCNDRAGLVMVNLGELAERLLDTFHFTSCPRPTGRETPIEDCTRCRHDLRVVQRYREYTRLAPGVDGHVGRAHPDGTWEDGCYVHPVCGLHLGGSMGTLMAHGDKCPGAPQ